MRPSRCLADFIAPRGATRDAAESIADGAIPTLADGLNGSKPDYAIKAGLARFEGGAQGEHKLSRGLEPVRTCSAHWIADPRFRDAVARFLAQERGGMEAYLDELSERLPFKGE